MNRDSRIVEIALEKIVPNRFQPRKVFNDDISELAESIRAHGVLQPITVRPLGEKFEIIMGERRFRACEKLGMRVIPAMIVEMSDQESMEVALIENLQRQDLSPIEEALSYKRILDTGTLTQEQLATRLGKNQSTIANKLRLLSLDKEVQSALLKGKISERHARSLLRLEDKNLQRELLNRIIEERLTVKKTDEEIKKMEKEYQENKEESQAVEIIDFDDNPFSTTTSNTEEANDHLFKGKADYDIYNQESAYSQESDYEDITKNTYITSESKPKVVVPTELIVDDFVTGNAFAAKTNHAFEQKVELEDPELQDDLELTNVEPDEILATTPSEAPIMPSTKNDFEQIKAIIANAENEIKKLGYQVAIEKFDFETMYQILFKITKN